MLTYLAGGVRRHRKKIGSCWRKLLPWKAGQLARAIHVLQAREISG